MVPKRSARVEGAQLFLRLIRLEDADNFTALGTDRAHNRHFSDASGTAEDQRWRIEGDKSRWTNFRELSDDIKRNEGSQDLNLDRTTRHVAVVLGVQIVLPLICGAATRLV